MVRTAAAREPDGVEAALARFGKTHPLGRAGTAADIANVVVFLASDAASFKTGEYVCVAGGYMALGAGRAQASWGLVWCGANTSFTSQTRRSYATPERGQFPGNHSGRQQISAAQCELASEYAC